jgi:hypothetical protein
MFTIAPPPPASKAGISYLRHRNTPRRLTALGPVEVLDRNVGEGLWHVPFSRVVECGIRASVSVERSIDEALHGATVANIDRDG